LPAGLCWRWSRSGACWRGCPSSRTKSPRDSPLWRPRFEFCCVFDENPNTST
jgi:hypothetical protein